jgi:hypothetical protein
MLAVALAALAVGCGEALPGRSRSLGEVDLALAYASAREVLATEHNFSIEPGRQDEGIVRTRPKPVPGAPDRLVGASPARQVVTVRLRRDGKEVVAHASAAVQRQRAEVRRQLHDVAENYDTVPNTTPSEEGAALTIEQRESWETVDYDHGLEVRILGDLYRALHPGGAPPAETAEPAATPPEGG